LTQQCPPTQLRDPGWKFWQQGTVAEQNDPGETVFSQQAPFSHPGFVAPACAQQLTVCPQLLVRLQLVGSQVGLTGVQPQ
jgi:hypothetical protein